MKNDYQSADFKKLLDKLQQESWQLELIISGFAIYGLFLCLKPLDIEIATGISKQQVVYTYVLEVLYSSAFIFLFVLLIHVVLRGLWIGSLGLRYVSGEINYDDLGYTQKFTQFLKKKSGSFDLYISRLENICSTLFALAFLMVFFYLSYFLVFGFLAILAYILIESGLLPEQTGKTVARVVVIIYALVSLIVFIDFLGMGILKKKKYVSRIYYPIYRFFSYLTLSFLYRPLVYNFLDQKRIRWVAIYILPVYMVLFTVIALFGNINSNYIFRFPESNTVYAHSGNYKDKMIEESDFVRVASIPSEMIEKPYLELFMVFNEEMEDAVFERDTTLIPKNDRRGFGLIPQEAVSGGGSIQISSSFDEKETEKYVKCIGDLYRIMVDDHSHQITFLLAVNDQDQLGFKTYLDILGLTKGKHDLRIIGPRKKKETFEIDTLVTIPFWYFPEN